MKESTGQADCANLGSLVGTFIYRESELVRFYDEILAALEDGSGSGGS